MGNHSAKELQEIEFGKSVPLTPSEEIQATKLLKESVLLRACSEEQLTQLTKQMEKKRYRKGEILLKEGEPCERMYVIANGETVREKIIDGQPHQVDATITGPTIGSLHVVWKDPSYSTTKCNSEVVAYELPSEALLTAFKTNPAFSLNVTKGLALEIRKNTVDQRTPLLEQHPKRAPIMSVSIAAGIESFYRAALNAVLNQQLTGQKAPTYFPNMHIQVPVRILYINGFKGIRAFLDNNVKPDEYEYPTLTRLAAAITPGLCMTPMSSILEASNAGHSNPEPMTTRWMRGTIPRAAREVIFGIGLNQLSDYCEERVPTFVKGEALRTAGGSLIAGVVCGYLSHVVHNLSTLKLMNPNKSYGEHFRDYVSAAEGRLPANIPARRATAIFTACVFPRGVLIRTTQIVGSFIVLNGTISVLHKYLPY